MMTMMTQSEAFTNKFTNVCRLCLREEDEMSSIFTNSCISGNDEKQDILAVRITSIAQVQISPTDGLPGLICRGCRRQVDQFYDFRLLVEISDRKLRSCFSPSKESSELRRISIRDSEDGKDVEYQEFGVETRTQGEEKDLLSVNAILVPSTSGMQVWQICNMDEESRSPETKRQYSLIKENEKICPKMEYNPDLENSDSNDFEGVKRCLTQAVAPMKLKMIEGEEEEEEEELYFTATSAEPEEKRDKEKKEEEASEMEENEDYDEEHLILEEYNCQLCLKSFHSLESLKNHVSEHFLPQDKSTCDLNEKDDNASPEINTIFLPDYDVRIEKNDDDEISPESECLDSLVCHSCDENFANFEDRIDNHARRDIIVKGLKCRHCDKSFLKLSSRNYHEESIHGSGFDKSHKCEECGKEFVKRSELRYHKGTHNKNPATCTICNKHFRNVQSFKMHLKRHTLGSRYNCADCGKSYYTNSELARHVQQHTGLREYPCDLCDMSFLSRPELNRHVKYHNGVKKFKCNVCNKSYYESGHLKVHERVHTGERPFACTICKKAFITKSKLARHCKIHEKSRGSQRESSDICEQYRFDK